MLLESVFEETTFVMVVKMKGMIIMVIILINIYPPTCQCFKTNSILLWDQNPIIFYKDGDRNYWGVCPWVHFSISQISFLDEILFSSFSSQTVVTIIIIWRCSLSWGCKSRLMAERRKEPHFVWKWEETKAFVRKIRSEI